MRILLVEDDDGVASALTAALQHRSHLVDRASTAASALTQVATADLILLDMGLPDQDGLALCREIRRDSQVPIIAVTARREESALVGALRSGVDDYVTKPYSLEELVARIDAVMRRFGHQPITPVTELGDLRLDPGTRQVFLAGEEITLTRKEFDLLGVLTQQRGDVVTREVLMRAIWDTTWVGASRTLDVHVATLRSKLDRPGLIDTVRGVGYRLDPGAAAAKGD